MQKIRLLKYAAELLVLGIQIELLRRIIFKYEEKLIKNKKPLSGKILLFLSVRIEKRLESWKECENKFMVSKREVSRL